MDIHRDVIDSFKHRAAPPVEEAMMATREMNILLEETDDNLQFATLVQEALLVDSPELTGHVHVFPSLHDSSKTELARYLSAASPEWSLQSRRNVLARVSRTGHPIDHIDPEQAFDHVVLARLSQGETLFAAGTAPAFAYIPLDAGLRSFPLGGYQSLPVAPWMPLAITSAIADSPRSGAVVAERTARVLMIPRSVYRRFWHGALSAQKFRRVVRSALQDTGQTAGGVLSELERSLLLANVTLFEGVEEAAQAALAASAVEVTLTAGDALFEKGDPGDSLYVVAAGLLEVYDGAVLLAELRECNVFGEIAVLSPELRMATVRAVTDCLLLQIDQRSLHDLAGSFPSVAHAVIQALIGYIQVDRTQRAALDE